MGSFMGSDKSWGIWRRVSDIRFAGLYAWHGQPHQQIAMI